MKKSLSNIFLYFPTAPAVIRTTDTQPFFLAVMIPRARATIGKWLIAFMVSLMLPFELLYAGAELAPTKIIAFQIFVITVLTLGHASSDAGLVNGKYIALILGITFLSLFIPLQDLYSSRPKVEGFRSIPFTFPEASYAAKFFYFYSVFRMLQNQRIGWIDYVLPLATLSLTGAILSIHLFLMSHHSLLLKLATLILTSLFATLIADYISLGRLSELIQNRNNIFDFIVSDPSFVTRTAYLAGDGSSYQSLLSLLSNAPFTACVLTATFLALLCIVQRFRLNIFYIFLSSFFILGYSDTYLQPFGILVLACCLRGRN
ncbi:hypothetical protein OAO10_05085 [Luminiphilus sp.]|nr:hypothetical protein [Luminiphilus sp.]